MKPITPEQQQRLDLLYAVLDRQYSGMRHFAALQRQAIGIGAEMAIRICDAQLITLQANLSPIWNDITAIVNPAITPEAAPQEPELDPEPAPDPAKVRLQ